MGGRLREWILCPEIAQRFKNRVLSSIGMNRHVAYCTGKYAMFARVLSLFILLSSFP
jgi:hypothetical protein